MFDHLTLPLLEELVLLLERDRDGGRFQAIEGIGAALRRGWDSAAPEPAGLAGRWIRVPCEPEPLRVLESKLGAPLDPASSRYLVCEARSSRAIVWVRMDQHVTLLAPGEERAPAEAWPTAAPEVTPAPASPIDGWDGQGNHYEIERDGDHVRIRMYRESGSMLCALIPIADLLRACGLRSDL